MGGKTMRYISAAFFTILFALSLSSPASAMPIPILKFTGTEQYTAQGQAWVRYRFTVTNRNDFSNNLFNPAPNLPPCGNNTNSARTWVYIHNSANQKGLQGFCALGSRKDLAGIWFSVKLGQSPPHSVYLRMNDRLTPEIKLSNSVTIP
jgi:hypothetical protein